MLMGGRHDGRCCAWSSSAYWPDSIDASAVSVPALHHLEHTLAVAELFVDLKTQPGPWRLVMFEAEPEAWREFLGGHGEPVTLKPDAFVELESATASRFWFVEIDRGTVSTASIRSKLKTYRSYLSTGREQADRGVFPRVVWQTPDGRRRDHVAELLRAENDEIGAELHRLLEDEWQPPPERAAP